MTNPKKPEPNPIEKAIGARAEETPKPAPITNLPNRISQNAEQIPEEPSPSEMLTLEELNRQTEERLRDDAPLTEKECLQQTAEIPNIVTPKSPIPVSKLDPQPVTKTSSPESPPQKIEEIDEYQDAEKGPQFELKEEIGIRGCSLKSPAEDIEFTALKKYIQEDGFVLATVAFHIVTLCAQPMVTPSTTTWDFRDRASVPDMVLALLNQPGYLEGIWPSLAVVMGSNKGNAAWCAGIATTIAFFDVIRTLPAIKELSNEEKS